MNIVNFLFGAAFLYVVGLAIWPDFNIRIGYKVRYYRNWFYRVVLKKCPFCKEDLSITSTGRGICNSDSCGKR